MNVAKNLHLNEAVFIYTQLEYYLKLVSAFDLSHVYSFFWVNWKIMLTSNVETFIVNLAINHSKLNFKKFILKLFFRF